MSSYRTIKPSVKPKYTLFVPWTRVEYADKMLNNINSLFLPREDMEVIFYIDTDNKELFKRLNDWCILNQFVYNGMKMIVSGNAAPPDYTGTPASQSNIIPRRARIVSMKEDSKQYIEASELVFGLEDDTFIPFNAFEKLLDDLNSADNIGFAMGVQQGRWNLPVIGAWRVDNIDDIKEMRTLPFEHESDVVDIDGGGYFCYLTPASLYKAHKYHWYDECFGPDATYGLELRKKGLRCLMDFRLICEHYTEQGILLPTPQNTVVATWRKSGERWIKEVSEK